ncbi:MAG: sulfotransferase [Paracoccaceae bacterium]
MLFEGRPLTTRGRWINPLVFAGYRLWSALPLRGRELRPIFILGVGRSGTTVLGTILALHQDVGYLNEPKALWHAALGNDDLIGSYSDQPGRYRMTRADAGAQPVRRLHRNYRAFLWLSRSRRVVDKYPELLFRNAMIDAAFPGAKKRYFCCAMALILVSRSRPGRKGLVARTATGGVGIGKNGTYWSNNWSHRIPISRPPWRKSAFSNGMWTWRRWNGSSLCARPRECWPKRLPVSWLFDMKSSSTPRAGC